MLCEMLGCLPSEIKDNHPNMTYTDYSFVIHYAMEKNLMIGKMMGTIKDDSIRTR